MRSFYSALPAAIAIAALAACSSGGGSSSLPAPQSGGPVTNSLATSTHSDFSLVEHGVKNSNVHIMGVKGSSLYTRPALGGTGLLPYNGGHVQTKVKLYVVYWGSSDPDGVQPRLNGFMGALGGSHWLGTTRQYYSQRNGNTYHIGNPTHSFDGSWVDTTNAIPTSPTDSDVQAEAQRAATHFGVSGINVSILVATEHDHNIAGFGTQFCAYHGYTSTFAYTNLPYMPDAGQNCGANFINPGPGGLLDGVTIVAGHEIAEAQTDPNPPSGWSGGNGEIGDLCAWQNIQNTPFWHTTYPTQPLYSDAVSGCVQ